MKIKKNFLKYITLLIPFLGSAIVYTQISDTFANGMLCLKVIVFAFITIQYIFKLEKITKFDISVFLYGMIWIFSTFINNENIISNLKEFILWVSIIMIIEYAYSKREQNELIDAMYVIIFVELLMNCIGFWIFPNGFYTTISISGQVATYSFLGIDNQVTPILIVATALFFIKLNENNQKLKFNLILNISCIVVNFFVLGSSTGITALFIICIVLLISKKAPNLLDSKRLLELVIVLFFMFVIFRVQNIFSFFIENILKKDLTFTNRTGIWDRAIILIKEKKLFGYGIGSMGKIIVDRNAHDLYLQVILQSGLIGGVSFLYIIYIALKKSYFNKNLNNIILLASLTGFLISSIFEVYNQMWLMIILALIYSQEKEHYKEEQNQKNEFNKKELYL